MTAGPATVAYAIPEEFAPALRCLRAALRGKNLRIAAELDLSRRIERSLRIKMAPCVVLYVWPSPRFLQSNPLSPPAALLLPLHVVVSGHGSRTDIHMLSLSGADGEDAMAPVHMLQADLRDILEKIAMRLGVVS